ncbi:MAG: pectin esterase [Clostridia bacterium]|nr:pectin esterase [Clostridia bacterium]
MKTLHLTPDCNLSEAINSSDAEVIYLSKGIYNQKTEILRDNLTIIGEGRETVLTFADFANKIHADGKEYNTFRTYTLCVTGNNIRLENFTVENSNTDPERVGQCVALSVHGDNFTALNMNLVSTQDTLFLSPFPDDLVVRYRGFIPQRQLYKEGGNTHLFKNCRISGTVDFIFGCAEAYFKNCEIISLKDTRDIGFVAAPAHPLHAERGFTFIDCDFKSDGANAQTVYLARPWRDFGKCAFINCKLGNHVNGGLFDKWNDTDRDKSARFYYFGLDCEQANPVGWGRKLTAEQANDIINDCARKFKTHNI